MMMMMMITKKPKIIMTTTAYFKRFGTETNNYITIKLRVKQIQEMPVVIYYSHQNLLPSQHKLTYIKL
jgi:hypothetical protein